MREGKGALAASTQAFKFIELYSVIQFLSIMMLFYHGGDLSDNQYLYIDVGVLVPLGIFSTWTLASEDLTEHIPDKSLFSPSVLVSIIV